MKISELQEILKEAMEEYGDVNIVIKHGQSQNYYDHIHYLSEVWFGNGYGYVPAIVVD